MSESSPPPDADQPTGAQEHARRELQEACQADQARKKRTRDLIQMGGICRAFGFDSPEQVEQILEALTRSRRGPDRLRALGVRETERWPRSSG